MHIRHDECLRLIPTSYYRSTTNIQRDRELHRHELQKSQKKKKKLILFVVFFYFVHGIFKYCFIQI